GDGRARPAKEPPVRTAVGGPGRGEARDRRHRRPRLAAGPRLLRAAARARHQPGCDRRSGGGVSGPVAGLAEIVLWVRDMDASMHFYRDLFGLELISPPALPNKFLRAGDGDEGVPEMIVLVPHPDSSSTFPREKAKRVLHHLAFRVAAQAYDG